MSDKKIAIIILVLAFGSVFGYWLFGWGSVEIFVGNEGVSEFELEMQSGKKSCENPCHIKLRPGKRIRAELVKEGFLSERIATPKASLFSQQKISLLLSPLSQVERIPVEDFVQREADRIAPFQKYKEVAIGPVRVNPEGSLAVFLRPIKSGKTELVLVTKAGKEQRLTVFQDTFLPSILEENFRFFYHGVLVPTTQKLYNYDFVTKRKEVLFTGKIFYLARVSHNKKGDIVLKTEKGWKIFSFDGSEKWLDESISWAQFSADSLWIVDGKQVKRDQMIVSELPEKVGKNDEIYFDFEGNRNTLWVHRDLEVWRVEL